MSEIKRSSEFQEEDQRDPYTDTVGVPYPKLPLKVEDAENWMNGHNRIFERMRQQEKVIVAGLRDELERFSSQAEFDARVAELEAAAAKLESQTVVVRNIDVRSPSGEQRGFAVMFKPRNDILQKDEEPIFGIMSLPS